MKKLLNTFITDTAQQPIKKGTLEFIQQAHIENTAATLIGLIGSGYNFITPYIISGCVNTGSGSNYVFSGGNIFYLGIMYAVPSATFTVSGGQVPVCVLTATSYGTDADPVTFTDGTTHNVHIDTTITIQAGASGSGAFDFSACTVANIVVANEQTRAQTAEAGLDSRLTAIEGGWNTFSDATGLTYTGSISSKTADIQYKIIGNTLHCLFEFGFTVGTSGSSSAPISFADASIPVSRNGLKQAYNSLFSDRTGHSLTQGFFTVEPDSFFSLKMYFAPSTAFPTGSGYSIKGMFTVDIL